MSSKLRESVPVGVNAHVVIRKVYGHANPNVTHVIRGKSAWGRAQVRRDGHGEAKVYACFEHPVQVMNCLRNWYTPATAVPDCTRCGVERYVEHDPHGDGTCEACESELSEEDAS